MLEGPKPQEVEREEEQAEAEPQTGEEQKAGEVSTAEGKEDRPPSSAEEKASSAPEGEEAPPAGEAAGPTAAPLKVGPEEEGAQTGNGESQDFASMLAESEERGREVQLGEKVSGVLVKIEKENSFVDFGGRSEGFIRTGELVDENGEMQFELGDPLEAFVASVQDGVVLTRRLGKEGHQADMLYQAYKAGIPIEGRVDAVNKWGLGITIQDEVRAFCPISQVDTHFVEDAEDYRGKTMTFKIIEFRNQGRNIVVSRRALLEKEKNREGDQVRAILRKGAEVEGKVTRLENFGAFVELGAGIEGLIHVSELSHQRVNHPQEVLNVGDQVKVVVLRTKDLGHRRKERISLSLKAMEKNPWEEVREQYPAGRVIDGKVDALEEFGAFVEVAPGIRGLLHVSEIADRRIGHPREVLELGQEVKVVVLEVDVRRRRLRLSMRKVESMESAANLKDFKDRQKKEKEGDQKSSAMLDALRRANLID